MPRRHIIRKLMPSYKALYRSKAGDKVVVSSLTPLPEKRKFKSTGGLRIFTKVREVQQLQEVIIVAKAAKSKGKKDVVVDDELDELEGIDELDELEEELDADDEDEDEDEPEDEDEDDDEDEEEEEAPKAKKGKSKPAAKRAPARPLAEGMVGSTEVAEYVGAKDARELRMVLRKLREKDDAFAPDSETGRYQWRSLKDKQVKAIKKAFAEGLHNKIKTESLERLKEQQAEKKAAKSNDASTKTKKGKKNKKSKKTSDDE